MRTRVEYITLCIWEEQAKLDDITLCIWEEQAKLDDVQTTAEAQERQRTKAHALSTTWTNSPTKTPPGMWAAMQAQKTQNSQAKKTKKDAWIREYAMTGVSMHNVDDMTEQDIKYFIVTTCKRHMNINGMRQANKGRTAFMRFDTEQDAKDVIYWINGKTNVKSWKAMKTKVVYAWNKQMYHGQEG